jgi:hypothetical protein
MTEKALSGDLFRDGLVIVSGFRLDEPGSRDAPRAHVLKNTYWASHRPSEEAIEAYRAHLIKDLAEQREERRRRNGEMS